MIDEWIDSALASYSAAEPVAGLDERVLNRIRIAQLERRRRSWIAGWALAIPVLASLLIAAVVLRTAPQKVVLTPPPRIALAPGLAAPLRNAPSKSARGVSIAKPSPSPISSQERALLALAVREPTAALQAFAELQKASDEPLDIQEIQIEPLQSDANQ